MKTSIKSLIALTLTSIVLTASTVNVKASEPNLTTVLSEVKKVNKINVSGNVELIIVQSADENVKVYDSYYAKNALVQVKDGELRISSFDKETLTVVVSVSNLNTITASGNATVKTFGKFNALSLAVNLNDNAKASLNTNTIDLYANLNNEASLSLTGTTTTYNAIMSSVATANMSQFIATCTNIQSKNLSIAKINAMRLLEAI